MATFSELQEENMLLKRRNDLILDTQVGGGGGERHPTHRNTVSFTLHS